MILYHSEQKSPRQRILFKMVQNTGKPRRGRPPAYDRDTALARAGDAFWKFGYAATTLDDLSTATGMNRPSLYGAFGDKHAIYMATLERYGQASQAAIDALLAREMPLAEQLGRLYDGALAIYLADAPAGRARGCFLVGTALTEAVEDDGIRTRLLTSLQAADAALEVRFGRARDQGELPADADPKALAQVAAAMLNALAVRARAGEAASSLRRTAVATVALLCGGGAAVSPAASPRPGARRVR